MQWRFLLYWFFLPMAGLLAQSPLAMHFTEKEGLPDREIYSIVEDDKGFIWLAADKGLFRYNCKTFELFTHPKQIDIAVFSLTKDQQGNIWYTNLANQLFCIKNYVVFTKIFGLFK